MKTSVKVKNNPYNYVFLISEGMEMIQKQGGRRSRNQSRLNCLSLF